MSNLTVSQLSGPAANSNQIVIPSGHTLYAPGHIIQVVNTYLTDPFTVSIPSTYNTFTAVTDLAATITPKSLSSKIYMVVRWFGEITPQTAVYGMMWNVQRNGTLIGQPPQPGSLAIGIHMASISYYGNDNDSTPENTMFDYLDSPSSTSAVTYQVGIMSNLASTLYVNRCVNAVTTGGYERGTSSITLMEIAQ